MSTSSSRPQRSVGGSRDIMQLPCRVCGSLITIPPKYRRATTAVHPHCLDFDRYLDTFDDLFLPKEHTTLPTELPPS